MLSQRKVKSARHRDRAGLLKEEAVSYCRAGMSKAGLSCGRECGNDSSLVMMGLV